MCLSPDLSAFMAGSRCISIYSISETFGDNNVEGMETRTGCRLRVHAMVHWTSCTVHGGCWFFTVLYKYS